MTPPVTELAGLVGQLVAIDSVTPSLVPDGAGERQIASFVAGPTAMLGPGGDGAHAEAEWVDLDEVPRSAEIYLAVARQICGSGSRP